MPIKSTTITEGEDRSGEEKISKRIYRVSQNIRTINVFLESLLSDFLSLAGSHSPPHLPRMSSNTVLVSGPVVGPAQILIWSYPSVFLPPMSTAVKTSAFSLVGALSDLLYIPQTQSLPSWSCGSNLQLAQLLGRFWVFFLSHTARWVSTVILFPLLHVNHPLGFAPEAAPEDLGLPLWGPGVEVVQLLGFQGLWRRQVCRAVDCLRHRSHGPIGVFFQDSCLATGGLFGQSFSVAPPTSDT